MQKVTSKDGTAIAYDKIGQGSAVILVSGAMIDRSYKGSVQLAEFLSAHFTIFNYDRRGRGDSGDPKQYAVEREIEDMEALIKEAGGSAFVYAMSSGAVLALEAAAHGLNIKKLALYEPPFMINRADRPPADHEAQLRAMVASGRPGDAAKYFMTKIFGMPAIVVAIIRLTPMWAKAKAVANSLPYDAAAMGDYSLPTQMLTSVKAPTLVVGGAKSRASLRDAVRAVADTVPNGQLRMLEGQTHNVSMKALAPVLVEFFKG